MDVTVSDVEVVWPANELVVVARPPLGARLEEGTYMGDEGCIVGGSISELCVVGPGDDPN